MKNKAYLWISRSKACVGIVMEELAQCEAPLASQQVGFSSVPCGLLATSIAM